jgi:hypothetical protein
MTVTTWRIRDACWISTYVHAHAHVLGTHMHAHTHAHTHTRKHAHTDQYVILIAFPQQKLFLERSLMLDYMHISCLVHILCRNYILEHVIERKREK